MSSDYADLLKVLKDKTRQKIVFLLNENQNLSYTDLLNNLEISSTGTLNYHLKVLNDLLAKNQSGEYFLTEKGRLAARWLIEFPESEKRLQTKSSSWKQFWKIIVILQFLGFVVVLVLYFLGYAPVEFLVQGVFSFFSGFIFWYFYYVLFRPPTDEELKKNPTRTIKDVFVSGRKISEVKTEVLQWIKDEKIELETETNSFIRGRLGSTSQYRATEPKFFEITLNSKPDGVLVHTEGYLIVLTFNRGEVSFAKGKFMFLVPRRQGLLAMQSLWKRLQKMSK